jgi:hypothetical protein
MKIKDEPQEVKAKTPEEPKDSVEDRKKDWAGDKKVAKQLSKLYLNVEKAFEDKQEQSNLIDECWDIYNCNLNANQQYNGKSQMYVPIVRDAMRARETRFINTLFPQNGRYADVIGSDGKVPYDLIALLDNYIERAKLRKDIVPGLIRAGDISGNYALYVEWGEYTRHIVSKEKTPAELDETGEPLEGTEEVDDVSYEEDKDELPVFSLLDTRDLVILPATCNNIRDAEVVGVALRYSEAKIHQAINEGIFNKDEAEELIENMSATDTGKHINTGKKATSAAGVRTDSKGNKSALIFQVWTKLKIGGEWRWTVSHFAGQDKVLGCKRNPYWNDRVPVILQAVEKEGNSIWGKSQVAPVKDLQYAANDAANMGADSAQYSLLPIVATNPEKNPNVGSLVLSMAAVWLVDPNDTKLMSFPPLWKDAFAMIGAYKDQIMQSLSVNTAMMPHGNDHKKPSQAEIAQAQQVAVESTNDPVSILQEVLSEALEWIYDLDYQYRTKELTVRKFGSLGLQATMDQVPLLSVRERLVFKWYGIESFKAMQNVQQMISWSNILTKIPPQALNGRKVDLGPMLEYITEVTCGPRIAPKTLIDERHMMSVDVVDEEEMIDNGFPVQTHPGDNDQEHMQHHMQHYKILPTEYMKGHILEHQKQMAAKAAAAAQQGRQQQLPPQGGGPKPGAQVQVPTGAQNPPGAVHPDNMPMSMPRK